MIYRLTKDIPDRDDLKAGKLVFAIRSHQPFRTQTVVTANGDGYGSSCIVQPDQIESAGDIGHRDFGEYLNCILAGRIMLPNFEPVAIDIGLNNIAAGGGLVATDVKHVLLPGAQSSSRWARAFLRMTQGRQYDGTGYLILYRNQRANGLEDIPSIGRFAICKHDIHDSSSPEGRNRGWHPAICRTCGLDMSVDSSD